MMINFLKKREIKRTIEATWRNPEGKEFRDKLFPEGKPTPEVFIQRISDYVRLKGGYLKFPSK